MNKVAYNAGLGFSVLLLIATGSGYRRYDTVKKITVSASL